MAFTEFCCRSGGSNLNAGTRLGDSTEPGVASNLTYASGSWVAATGIFTVAAGDPVADGVAVGDFASVYADGSTVTGFVGRVTARTVTTITVSLTAKAGTAPTDGVANRTLKIGGAWQGPNAAEGFPFNFVQTTLTNVVGSTPRVNLKNAATYSITAALTHTLIGPCTFQGYAAAYNDSGKAIIDGGVVGASYVLLTLSTNILPTLVNFILQNNGATGSATGLLISVGSRSAHLGVVVNSVRGTGFQITGANVCLTECETYSCNQSNTATLSGFDAAASTTLVRCISHDNTTSNTSGFKDAGFFVGCIADTNGQDGFLVDNSFSMLLGCESYNNGRDGFRLNNTSSGYHLENCNAIRNGGWGINGAAAAPLVGFIVNCGFGSGTQANTSGTTTGLSAIVETGSVIYPADVTPWVAPTTGDFRITLPAAKGTGRGTFTQTQAGPPAYTGTVGYPDIGAAQHPDQPTAGVFAG
jgi:hypothetical protein